MSAASSLELVAASLLAGSRPGPTESSRREPGWSLSRLPTLSGFPHLVALAASSGKPAARAYRFASCAAPGSPPRRAPSLGRPSPPAGARQERVSVNTSRSQACSAAAGPSPARPASPPGVRLPCAVLPAPRVAPYWFGALPSGLRGFPLAPGVFPSPQVPRRPRASGSSCLGLRRSFRVSRSRLAALQGLAALGSASRGVFSPFAPTSAGSPRFTGLPLPLRSAFRFWSTSWRLAPARALRLQFC
jgi:hypothetical protein